jgi:hypothetical protein
VRSTQEVRCEISQPVISGRGAAEVDVAKGCGFVGRRARQGQDKTKRIRLK